MRVDDGQLLVVLVRADGALLHVESAGLGRVGDDAKELEAERPSPRRVTESSELRWMGIFTSWPIVVVGPSSPPPGG